MLEMRAEMTGTTNTGVPALGATPVNQIIQAEQPSTIGATYNQSNSVATKMTAVESIIAQSIIAFSSSTTSETGKQQTV